MYIYKAVSGNCGLGDHYSYQELRDPSFYQEIHHELFNSILYFNIIIMHSLFRKEKRDIALAKATGDALTRGLGGV